MKLSVAGKTGTAQEDMSRPSHGLFIGFAPYDNPEVGVAVHIGNGYSSGNAVKCSKKIFSIISTILQMKLKLSPVQHLLLTRQQHDND